MVEKSDFADRQDEGTQRKQEQNSQNQRSSPNSTSEDDRNRIQQSGTI